MIPFQRLYNQVQISKNLINMYIGQEDFTVSPPFLIHTWQMLQDLIPFLDLDTYLANNKIF